jgi:hypothetical protein
MGRWGFAAGEGKKLVWASFFRFFFFFFFFFFLREQLCLVGPQPKPSSLVRGHMHLLAQSPLPLSITNHLWFLVLIKFAARVKKSQ